MLSQIHWSHSSLTSFLQSVEFAISASQCGPIFRSTPPTVLKVRLWTSCSCHDRLSPACCDFAYELTSIRTWLWHYFTLILFVFFRSCRWNSSSQFNLTMVFQSQALSSSHHWLSPVWCVFAGELTVLPTITTLIFLQVSLDFSRLPRVHYSLDDMKIYKRFLCEGGLQNA